MTVHKAPQALCVQLKRFTPWGRKIPSTITYERKLTLAPAMSEKQVRMSLSPSNIETHLVPRSRQRIPYTESLSTLAQVPILVITIPTLKGKLAVGIE